MRIEPMGERAVFVRDLPQAPSRYANSALRIPGVQDVVCAIESIGLYFEEVPTNVEELLGAGLVAEDPSAGRLHRVPVCFEMGEDLGEAAEALRVSVDSLMAKLDGFEFECLAIGFCPGFPYLGHLPSNLSRLPRRAEPRPAVPPGSFAIANDMACFYPLKRPGGWWLLGRTPLELVNVAEDYFPLAPGDRVKIIRISVEEFNEMEGARLEEES